MEKWESELIFIKQELINACLKKNSSLFLNTLKQERVKTKFPNKTSFYSFFKYMIKCTSRSSIGELRFEIDAEKYENVGGNPEDCYNFYDEVHHYPMLTLFVLEKDGFIELDVSPF
jgi:hypothetical protein|tara:strand:- start:2068 stop:2415 length:348 start_codon:yes stop_codon:yes gene_type:complete